MDKNTFEKIKKYTSQCSVSVVGSVVPVYDGSQIMPDELGWATEKGVYINYKHEIINKLPYDKQIVFVVGVIVHELMHKVYSDFDILKYGLAKYKGDSTMQRLVKEIANIIEDPAIEYMAQFKIGGYLLKCLRFSVRVIYNLNPALEESGYSLSQLMSAYIMYGDMGIVKGNFTFPEAKEAFIKTLPIMDKAIDSFSAKNRFIAAEEVAEIIKDLMDVDDMGDDAMDDFDNQMSQSGRSMSPQGTGSAKEELEEDEKESSSSEEQKKERNRQKTKNQIKNSSKKKDKSGQEKSEESEDGNGSSDSNKSEEEKSSKQSQSGNDDEEGKDEQQENSSSDEENGEGKDSENNQNQSSSDSDNEKSAEDETTSGNEDDSDSDSDSQSKNDQQVDMNNMPESHRQKITNENHDITSADGVGLEEGNTTFEDDIYEITPEDIAAILEEIKEANEVEEPTSCSDDLDEFTDTSEEVKEFQLRVENKKIEIGENIVTMQTMYNDVLDEVGDVISSLTRGLKKIFRQDVENKDYTTTGRVSMKRLASGRQTSRVFEKVRQPKNKQQMKVCILVDESGSMSDHNKAKVAKKTAIVLAEVFGKLNIPIAVMGFTTGLRGYQVNHHHYLHWDNSNANRLKLLNISANGGNYDAFAVRTAAKMMKKKKSVYDILIIISDGEPSFGLGQRGERLTDLANAVHQTKKQVKNIIGIGLGNINTSAFEKFYGNDFIHVPNIKDLPILLTNAIKRMVKKW